MSPAKWHIAACVEDARAAAAAAVHVVVDEDVVDAVEGRQSDVVHARRGALLQHVGRNGHQLARVGAETSHAVWSEWAGVLSCAVIVLVGEMVVGNLVQMYR